MRWDRWIKATAMGLCGCLLLSLCGFQAECERIADSVLRLHILANSDSDEDQALKYKVRDAVLEETEALLSEADDKGEALAAAQTLLPTVRKAAEDCLRRNGCDDAVDVELCRMYFNTRRYETGVMPAGYYQAVRVRLGEAAGRNWWCVLFPPMCVGSAEELPDGVFNEAQEDIVTHPERYEVRFKLVEWFYDVCRWFS